MFSQLDSTLFLAVKIISFTKAKPVSVEGMIFLRRKVMGLVEGKGERKMGGQGENSSFARLLILAFVFAYR